MFTKYVVVVAEIMSSVMTEIMMRRLNQAIDADKTEAVTVAVVAKLLEEAIDLVPNMPFMLKPMMKAAMPSIAKTLLDVVEIQLSRVIKS